MKIPTPEEFDTVIVPRCKKECEESIENERLMRLRDIEQRAEAVLEIVVQNLNKANKTTTIGLVNESVQEVVAEKLMAADWKAAFETRLIEGPGNSSSTNKTVITLTAK